MRTIGGKLATRGCVAKCCGSGTGGYVEAKQCPGDTTGPRVFVPTDEVDGCYTGPLALSAFPLGSSHFDGCYTVYPGISRTYTAAEVAAADGLIYGVGDAGEPGTLSPAYRGKTCCTCGDNYCDTVSGSYYDLSTPTGGQLVHVGPCCCSRAARTTTDYTVFESQTYSPDPYNQTYTHTKTGHSVTVTDDSGSIISETGTQTETWTGPNPSTTTSPWFGYAIECLPTELQELDLDATGSIPGYTASQRATCNSYHGQSSYSYTRTFNIYDPTGTTVIGQGTTTYTQTTNGDITVESLGQCGGGCDGSTGPGGSGGIRVLPAPIPRSQWPLPFLAVAMAARKGDRGIGDTIARVIGPIGGNAFKRWHRRVTGEDCGCGARADFLNAKYPY